MTDFIFHLNCKIKHNIITLLHYCCFSGGFLQSIGDSNISDIGINQSGTIIYLALGNSVKMIDLRTYVFL